MDRHGVDAGRHGFSRDLTELLLVRVVLVESVYHLARDALGTDACQPADLFCLRAVGVERSKLATRISEQNQEVVGL